MVKAMPIPASPRPIAHRTASRRSADILPEFHKPAESRKVATQTIEIAVAMTDHTAMLNGVDTLKWLVEPTDAMPVIAMSSTTSMIAMRLPIKDASFLPLPTKA